MLLMAIWFAAMALGCFVAAIIQITKARGGLVVVFAVLAFAFGGSAGAFAAA